MNALRWSLAVAAIVLAMVVASITAEPEEWIAVVQWARARGAELDREFVGCPVLLGEPRAADSAAARNAAVALAANVGPAEQRLRNLLEDPAAWPLTAADRATLEELAPAMQALRDAARAARDVPQGSLPDGWFGLLPAADALLVGARAAPAGAADPVGDVVAVLACGIDLAAAREPVPQLLGLRLVESSCDACTDEWIRDLPAGPRQDLAAALATADRSLPVVSTLPSSIAVHLVDMLASPEPVQPFALGMWTALAAWRHGFSVRRSGIARANQLVAEVRRFEQQSREGETWPDRSRRLRALVDSEQAANADLLVPFLRIAFEGEHQRRLAAAKLRLLRHAVAVHAGQDLPALADPLGAGRLAIEAGARWTGRSAGGIERTAEPRR